MDHCYEFIKHEVNERAYYQLEIAKYLPLVYKELKDFFTGSMPTILYELIFSTYAGDDALQYTLDNNTVMDELLGDLPTLIPTE